MRYKMIVSVYLLLIDGKRVLLSRRFQTGYEDGKYSLPAGHVEEGESLTLALTREIKEELGIVVRPHGVRFAHLMHRKEEDERIDVFFVSRLRGKKPKNCEPEKCDELRWVSMHLLPRNTVSYIRQAIGAILKKQWYGERGW